MTSTTDYTAEYSRPFWFERSETWLDRKGKGAWIAAMVLGFIFFWPVGLALLAYMIWSKKMFGKSRCCSRSTHYEAMRPTGNKAFDAYKHDTLTRLANEQEEFLAFLERRRHAKDRAEFDEFLKALQRNGFLHGRLTASLCWAF